MLLLRYCVLQDTRPRCDGGRFLAPYQVDVAGMKVHITLGSAVNLRSHPARPRASGAVFS